MPAILVKKKKRVCEWCGKEFKIPKHRQEQRFCGKSCAASQHFNTPKMIEMSRQLISIRNQDPEFCRKRAESVQTPEIRKMHSRVMSRNWQNPEFVKNNSETSRRTMNDPEFRKMLNETHRTPEAREQTRQQLAKKKQDPEFVRKQAESVRTPEERKRRSELMVEMNKDPEFKKAQGLACALRVDYTGSKGTIPMKASWEPDFAARIMDLIDPDWKYEPVTYEIEFEGTRLPSYTPDFWSPMFNCYFEVKGRDVELAFVRAQLCKLLHNVDVVVLDGPRLEELGLWDDESLQREVVIEKLKEFYSVQIPTKFEVVRKVGSV